MHITERHFQQVQQEAQDFDQWHAGFGMGLFVVSIEVFKRTTNLKTKAFSACLATCGIAYAYSTLFYKIYRENFLNGVP